MPHVASARSSLATAVACTPRTPLPAPSLLEQVLPHAVVSRVAKEHFLWTNKLQASKTKKTKSCENSSSNIAKKKVHLGSTCLRNTLRRWRTSCGGLSSFWTTFSPNFVGQISCGLFQVVPHLSATAAKYHFTSLNQTMVYFQEARC